MSYLRLSFMALTAVLMACGLTTAFAEEEQSTETTAVETEAIPTYELVWSGPRSLDTLVDERRDALRDRREAFHDNLRARHGMYTPWMDHERKIWKAYSDQMRDIYRAQRDANKFYHDQFRMNFMPWSQAFHDRAEARRFAIAMDNLDRQEIMDEIRFTELPLLGGLFPW
ncbi:MAG: hypothetical protein PVI52_06245 [Chromatiales bacterium]